MPRLGLSGRRQRLVSGIKQDPTAATNLDRIESLLDREVSLAAVDSLSQALRGSPVTSSLDRMAFIFDSSVFLRLAQYRRSADVLDYLARHPAPLVLPGQAIQEFWNNRMSVIESVASKLKKSFDELTRIGTQLGPEFATFGTRLDELLASFVVEYGDVWDPDIREKVSRMLDILAGCAHTEFVPRSRFKQIADDRHLTKTPPGFNDAGHGDFFVWVDSLFSLLNCIDTGGTFECVTLLTNDEKSDWTSSRAAHPLLAAEIRALFDCPLLVWNLKTFTDRVEATID